MKKIYVYLSKSWNMYPQQNCCDWWPTYSYISLRGTSVARNEERNQISYIFQVHFTLKPGCDCYVFFCYLINNKGYRRWTIQRNW